jgi:rhodanese-related sulfurtransferase
MPPLARILALSIFFALNTAHAATEKPFSTKPGMGFDKQASIWLIEKYVTPRSEVQLVDSEKPLSNTRYFDEPGGEFMRDGEHSTYEQLFAVSRSPSEYLRYLVSTVHDIEINLWLPDERSDSRIAESAFRDLQNRWGRDRVPRGCYREFFNRLEALYSAEKSLQHADQILPQLSCWKQALTSELTDPNNLVTEMPIGELLGHMRSGAKVAFVDVREPDEFAENHIPGAINLTIADANSQSVQRFKEFDVVVAYCIKDFRGFEMARKLRDLGIKQSAILNPYGIKGWISSSMPVYKAGNVSEQQAARSLDTCVSEPNQCGTPKP